MLQIEKDSPIPLYHQILNWIRGQILSGQWKSGMRLPTENELVEALGVSRVTVRQALGAAVDEKLLVRVAGRGTFVAERVAQTPTRKFIGYIVPTLSHSFNIQPLLGVESVIQKEGYHLIFATSEGSLEKENLTLRQQDFEGVDGFIVSPVYAPPSDRYLHRLVAANRPVVQIDRCVDGLAADVVSVDHYGGEYALTRHLIEQGYTDLMFFGRQPFKISSVADRYRAFQAALRDAGLPERDPLLLGDELAEINYTSIPELVRQPRHPRITGLIEWFSGGNVPQAIVAMNDLHALLITEAAHYAGLKIPEDVAVVGFDNLDFTATMNPPLTTVAQPPYEMGVAAANQLLRRIEGQKQPPETITLPYRLVVRASSAAPSAHPQGAGRRNTRSEAQHSV